MNAQQSTTGGPQVGKTPSQASILIVEDHVLMRTVLIDFVRQTYAKLVVVSAQNGAEALQQMALRRPSVVLMDINLPDANGIDLIASCREILAAVQVIVLSHSTGVAYEEHARDAGACGYVVKDRIFSDLSPQIDAALARFGEND